ncbi:Aldose reductase [Spironucleus salmonicida]|uniref:Aldo/keto reductase n=1 Tax=Spironucleus salmonicida TaxID=348837 RepID=V6LP61_9EUKA|nr:Aldose reductase [Spironucleus salmonicida]|eukprot:EST46467.1 Aldo/keto reductase [Spironucleus salmonicida]
MIPQIGFGTYQAPLDATKEIVLNALNTGYKHIDCAFVYKNETAVGEAFQEFFQSHDRSDYWITTKLWNTNHNPSNVTQQLQQQLVTLKLDYVDLFLIHWPVCFQHGKQLVPRNDKGEVLLESGFSIMDTYRAMESLVDTGLTKHIGVSNFNVALINDLLSGARIKPLVNQIESHPFFQNEGLIQFCLKNGLHITAYSPLGGFYQGVSGIQKFSDDVKLQEIALGLGVSIAQIVLKWHLQRFNTNKYSIIPKSSCQERIKSNFKLEFTLTEEQMIYINSLNKNERSCDPIEYWQIPLFD